MTRIQVVAMLDRTHRALSSVDPATLLDGASVPELAELFIAASRVFAFQAALLRAADKQLLPEQLIQVYELVRAARVAAQAEAQFAAVPTEGRA